MSEAWGVLYSRHWGRSDVFPQSSRRHGSGVASAVMGPGGGSQGLG